MARWLRRVSPPIYIAFLVLFGIAVVLAIVIGFVALTDPAAIKRCPLVTPLSRPVPGIRDTAAPCPLVSDRLPLRPREYEIDQAVF